VVCFGTGSIPGTVWEANCRHARNQVLALLKKPKCRAGPLEMRKFGEPSLRPGARRVEKKSVQVHRKTGNSAARRRRGERGTGRGKAIAFTAIFVLAIYAAVKIVPAYFSEYQLADKMQEQARFAVVNHYTDEQIRDNVYKVVQDLQIPAKAEDIKVTSSQSLVTITMDYKVPVDLMIYKTELHFTPSSENKSVY